MPKFKAFPKNESNTTYGECTAEDFNTLGYEIQNTIESANIATSLNENNQLSKAIANYISIGALYNDVTTDYSHINLSIKAPFVAPTQYFDGMVVSFLPQGNNLENATINVNGLGEVQIRAKLDEEGILADKIVLNEYIQLVYNSQINSFVIFSTSSNDDKYGQNIAGRYLLEPVWASRILKETAYLRSDTFNWYDGVKYKQAYKHILNDYNHSSIEKQDFLRNVILVGSLQDNQGVLSDFSANSYAILPEVFAPADNTWEMVFKINFNTASTIQHIIANSSSNDHQAIVLRLDANNKLQTYLSSNGTSWNITGDSGIEGSNVFSINTDYYIKMEFTGTQYIVSYSTDNEEWTADITINNENSLYQSSALNSLGYIGLSNQTSNVLQGSIDLNESYININGERWWSGRIYINYKVASDGDKIINATDTETLTNLEIFYNNTGIAWYYILDTENTRFKLPRSQWSFVGLRPDGSVGDYVEESLPNIKGTARLQGADATKTSGCFDYADGGTGGEQGTGTNKVLLFDASKSSQVYKDGATVQTPATQMILYFYIGGEEEEPEEIVIRNRNIGEIFTAILPVNDTGIIRLFGQEIDVSVDTYKGFYQVLKQLKSQGTCPNLFCTETEWQEFYTQYNFCPKFVVNEESNTIRLPLLKGYCKNVNSLEELGKINEAGLPNITGSFSSGAGIYVPQGAFVEREVSTSRGVETGTGSSDSIIFDASHSNPIYKDSLNTVEVDGYNALVYLVIANSTEEKVSVIEDYEINNTVPLSCPIYSPNMFEDINYLLSDNQWHSGEIYNSEDPNVKSLWGLLTSEYNNENSIEITKTLSDGTSLTLKKTPLDYLICKIDENNTEEKINRFYNEKRFTCWVLDTTNNRFKLPQNTKRELVESWKDGNGGWYNLYSDGWVEQGGYVENVREDTTTVVNLFVVMKDGNYSPSISNHRNASNVAGYAFIRTLPTSTIMNLKCSAVGTTVDRAFWTVNGYANTSALNNQFNFSNYLYFKVGNTTVGAELVYANKTLEKLDKKANLSLDNINDTAKQNIKSLNSPDWSRAETINVASMNIDDTYTFSEDGILYIYLVSGSSNGYVSFKSSLDSSQQSSTYIVSITANNTISLEYRVQKGEVITLKQKKYSTLNVLFLPLK